jgi:hypothetical protein
VPEPGARAEAHGPRRSPPARPAWESGAQGLDPRSVLPPEEVGVAWARLDRAALALRGMDPEVAAAGSAGVDLTHLALDLGTGFMPATARPAPLAAAPRRAAPHAPLPAPSSSIPSARRDPAPARDPRGLAGAGRAIAPALHPRTTPGRSSPAAPAADPVGHAAAGRPRPRRRPPPVSRSRAASWRSRATRFRNDILVTRQAGGYRVSDQLAALQLVAEPTPVRVEMPRRGADGHAACTRAPAAVH